MAAERTLRRPKHPRLYALLIGLVALTVAVGVAGAWRAGQGALVADAAPRP